MREQKNAKTDIAGIILLAAAGLFTVGMLTFLKPCGIREDGTWMHCHEAGTWLSIAAAAALAAAIARLLVRSARFRLIADTLLILLSVTAILLPGTVISLCMMPGMRCRAVMKPGAAVFSSIIIVFALLDIAMLVIARKRDTKRASL